ncbi:hypothetical protein N7462_005748 [Penicillium macrosclerotiorum]|uniref:uncharacterized protein n=1 Tax=Penicillium macrosclerotiorum TaxID=303699 RepID=UPI0025480063|nr:uncharacterized protein N7462_005748 [Penicillium macrosclerotiorum]KAJ5682583.1 hypothetical protein N7462_005748 [Penicillium macrosclerotiorum]
MTPTVKEFTKTIKDFLRSHAHRKDLKRLVENVDESKSESKSKLPTLAVSTLKRHEVEAMLHLKLTANDPDLGIVPPMPLPTGLRYILRVINATVDQNDISEAKIRICLNMLLICAQYHVRLNTTHHGRSLYLKPESTWRYGPVKDHHKKGQFVWEA